MLYDDRHSACFDPAEAVRWYQTAVEGGGFRGPEALLALARHYRDGIGVPKSTEIARIWLQRLLSETTENYESHREGRKLMEELDTYLL